MSATGLPGPLSVEGLKPPQGGATPALGLGAPPTMGQVTDISAACPQLFWAGAGVRDPRWLQRIGAGANVGGVYANQDLGFFMAIMLVMDAAPSALGAANIAALANVTSGTPMTLALASTGITLVPAGGVTPLPTQTLIPAGALVIDGLPAWVGNGFNFLDPATSVARAVSITGVVSGTGGIFIVAGNDIYGEPMSESINATAGATTTNGKKAFKFIRSVTPQFTDAHNYSVGTLNIFGFPLRVDRFAFADMAWNDAVITANTGFVAADATDPATTTTGDTRGTWNLGGGAAANGTIRLQIWVKGSVANLVNIAGWLPFRKGLLGMPQV